MVYIYLAILGLLFGSFFLVVGLRLPKNESIIKPDSHCDHCQKKLKWYHMIPLFSYIFLRGKCAYCKEKVSILNPVVEFFTSLLFVVSYYVFGWTYECLIFLVAGSVLIITYVSDFKYLIILDSPTIVGSILVLIITYFKAGWSQVLYSILWGIILFLIMLLIKIIGDKVFKRESLGGGDVKLSFFIGILLGLKLGLISFVIASFIALPYAFIYTLMKKEKEIPFGPFLITGAMIVLLFYEEITAFLDFLLYF